MTRTQRRGAELAFSGISRLHNQYCNNETKFFQEYKQHAACLRKTRDQQQLCYADLKVALESMTQTTWDQRMDLTCCAYNRVTSCIRRAIRANCGKQAVIFIRKMIRTAMSRLPEIVCSSTSLRSETCQLLPAPGSELTGDRSGKPVFRLLPNLLPDPDDGF